MLILIAFLNIEVYLFAIISKSSVLLPPTLWQKSFVISYLANIGQLKDLPWVNNVIMITTYLFLIVSGNIVIVCLYSWIYKYGRSFKKKTGFISKINNNNDDNNNNKHNGVVVIANLHSNRSLRHMGKVDHGYDLTIFQCSNWLSDITSDTFLLSF